jgi:hypothetical protein
MEWITSALALTCLLAGSALPARQGIAGKGQLAVVGAFAATLAIALRMPFSMGSIGLCISVLAGWQLLRPGRAWIACAAGGICAALGAACITGQGAPWLIAALLALAIPLCSLSLARRRAGFATVALRDEALAGLTISALILAAVPSVMSGWQSALVLNRTDDGSLSGSMSAWVWGFALLAVVAGILHEWWVRR